MSKKLINFLKNDFRWLLVLILIVAAFLRFAGASPGYPPYHPDEGISYSAAVSMIKNGNLDPLRYDYPALVPLVNAFAFRFFFIPITWAGYYLTHISEIFDGLINIPIAPLEAKKIFQLYILGEREINALFWGRYVAAFFGTAVVFLTYLVGKRLFNLKVGLLSALLVAVNYREVLNSHLGLPDIYNAFFLLLAFLAALWLWERPSRRNYLIVAVTAGLSFSTKYQFFAFVPLFLVHLWHSLVKKTLNQKLKFFLRREALAIPFVILLLFTLLNPYHFINFEETVEWLASVSGKYRTGRMQFDFYPISYLYHLGLGKITSIIVLLGIFMSFFHNGKKTTLLLSIIIPFFFVMAYYTGGGFYTRNFITIIPFLLVFAAVLLGRILDLKFKLRYLLFLAVLVPALWGNLYHSLVVAVEYARPWNFKILSSWVEKNIPAGSRVAAHSSVPLPVEGAQRLPFDFSTSFSLEEFREDGADYAIANLDWATNEFYWWMTRNTQESLRFWNKPTNILDYTYSAMALREMSDFAAYALFNSWQAPDSNFIVSPIPEVVASRENLVKLYNFDGSDEGWSKQGQMWYSDENLGWEKGRLAIKQGTPNSPILRWESPPTMVENWQGFLIKAKIKVEGEGNLRNGFLAAHFYRSAEEAQEKKNRIGVRLTSRNRIPDRWVEKELAGTIPPEAGYMVVSFHSYSPSQGTLYLDEIGVYQALIEADFGGVEVSPIKLDDNLIFPSSHGYL